MDKFTIFYRSPKDREGSKKDVHLFTPRLAQFICFLVICVRPLKHCNGFKRPGGHGLNVKKVSYSYELNTLPHDEKITDYEKVMHICKAVVTKLPGMTVSL